MVEEKKGIHRAYLVFAGVCAMMAGGMGLVLNAIGNFFMPIATSLDISITEVTFIMTVYSLVMLVWLPIAGRLFDKVDGRILFGVAGTALAISIALNGIWTSIWGFYASAVIWGFVGPFLFLVGPSVLINNWFASHRAGRMLGIASAFTGVGTFVWSPLMAGLIGSIGYQSAFFVEAAICFVLIVPLSVMLFRVHPQDMGLKPYGIDDVVDEKKSKATSFGGMAPKVALGTLAFYAIFISACLISLGGGYKSTMPAFAVSIGSTAMVGASMISAAAVGNILGKITLGLFSDKIGTLPTIIGFSFVAILGFTALIFCGGATGLMLAGGFFIGTTDAMMSVGLPLITRTVFGLKNYSKIYSYLNMGIAILGGFGAVVVAFIFESTGTFTVAYVIGVCAYVVVGLFLSYALLASKKLKKKWEE